MPGWIKLEKDLLTDPRLTALAAKIGNADVTHDGVTNLSVTLALGALARLWLTADTHIRDDDTLRCGAEAINQLTGVTNFAQMLPAEWLQVIDADNVKLPEFHQHNGTSARSRALTQVRVANYRKKRNGQALHGNGVTLTSVTTSLPDLDLDLDLKKKSIQKKKDDEVRARKAARRNAQRLPEDWAPDAALVSYAQNLRLDAKATTEAFRDHWLASNLPTATKRDWAAAFRTWCRRAVEGPSLARVPASQGGVRRDDSGAWAEIKTRGAALGFREPWPLESLGAYTTAVKLIENTASKSVLHRIAAQRGGGS